MNKLTRILIIIFLFLSFNGCASLYVQTIVGKGVQSHVKKEMIEKEKRIREEQRLIDKKHKEDRKRIQKAQKQSWK